MYVLCTLYVSDSYADYYGNDEDVLAQLGPEEATDATFQQNPEHYVFSCLSEEEAWNYLNMQVMATAREIKVSCGGPHHFTSSPLTPVPPPSPG